MRSQSAPDVGASARRREIALQQFELIEHSFIGKTIKESKIREITQGLVVGVEHNGRRILNPESNLILSKNDIVWVVGDKKKIKHFFLND